MSINPTFSIEEILEAMKLILEKIVFTFGDTHWLQETGVAMGTLSACVLAALYFVYPKLFKLILILR